MCCFTGCRHFDCLQWPRDQQIDRFHRDFVVENKKSGTFRRKSGKAEPSRKSSISHPKTEMLTPMPMGLTKGAGNKSGSLS